MNILSRLGDSIEIYFANLAQLMDITMRNKDFIAATVTPNATHYELNKSLLALLASLTSRNALIQEAYYYIRATNFVYTSTGQRGPFSRFRFGDAVTESLRQEPDKKYTLTATPRLSVVHAGGELFVLQDFFTERRLATMFFRIDSAALRSLINGKTPRNHGTVYTYDADLSPLFPDQAYPAATPKELAAASGAGDGKPLKLRGVSYYHYKDENTGWLFMLSFPAGYSLGQRLALGVIIPFLFFFLIINLAVFIYSTLSVYRPVDEIMKSITGSTDTASTAAPGGARSEFDFIKNAFDHVVGANEQYETLLRKFAPGVQERLFSLLVSGREIPASHVLDVLNGVHSPFARANRFLAIAFRLDRPVDHKSELEADMAKVHLREALADTLPERLHLFWFLGRNDDIVAILGFQAESGAFLPARLLAAVDRCAREYSSKTTWNIFWGCGEIYNDILDIAYSYEEAVNALRMKQYSDHQAPEEDRKMSLCVSADSIMGKQVDNIWRHIVDRDVHQAQSIASRIVAELAENTDGANRFTSLTNIFVKRLVGMQISPEDLTETEQMMAGIETDNPNAHAMQEFVQHCIVLLDRYNRKRQNKYILGAVEYITEHYSNSDLSLSSVSEYLGIHSSYLSRLFNEARNKSFTTELNEYRIEMARQLLQLTTQSIAEIGFQTGFKSSQNFTRVFKKHMGMPPGQYREQHGK